MGHVDRDRVDHVDVAAVVVARDGGGDVAFLYRVRTC